MAAQHFNLDEMMAAAERATGCSDWGDDDIRTPLEILFKAFNAESGMDERGRARCKNHMMSLFRGRLRLFDDRKKYPEITRQEIRAPIFMGGMPRAGTSYLNSLIACDPNILALFQWQAVSPSPPPNHPGFDHAPQIAFARELMY